MIYVCRNRLPLFSISSCGIAIAKSKSDFIPALLSLVIKCDLTSGNPLIATQLHFKTWSLCRILVNSFIMRDTLGQEECNGDKD
jgi:hypothetical protein